MFNEDNSNNDNNNSNNNNNNNNNNDNNNNNGGHKFPHLHPMAELQSNQRGEWDLTSTCTVLPLQSTFDCLNDVTKVQM